MSGISHARSAAEVTLVVAASRQPRFNAFNMWQRLGITEHPGGLLATRKLAEMCGIKPGQLVLDIGCGTGYTASLLAKEYGVKVVAVDLTPGILEWAKRRIAREGTADRVTLAVADAQNLPFKADSFDVVIGESVLIFCDAKRAASEVFRVLKQGGAFGDNEVTLLKPLPDQLRRIFSEETLGVNANPMLEGQWQATFSAAGFSEVSARPGKIDFLEQLRSHLQVDGLRQYLLASIRAFLDPAVLSLFLRPDLFKAAVQLPPYLGYALYVARK